MSKPLEIFENEEAEKLLDYFVAYKKLNEIADFFRCAAKVNPELNLHRINPQPQEAICSGQAPFAEPIVPFEVASEEVLSTRETDI
jgi:hypothetical protein